MDFDSYRDHTVRLAVDLVNTRSPVSQEERLTGAPALRAFLREHGVRPHAAPGRPDVEEVREVRERLRQVFDAPNEHAATAVLNDLLREMDVRPYLAAHDGEPWHLHYAPTEAPVARHLASIAAMGLAVVIGDGGFGRLGVCSWERCRDVFVDASKNRSRRYCDPAVCGNRASAAAHRARRRRGVRSAP